MTDILVLNEPYVRRFCRTQRWAARTRAGILRPPDWLAYATAVLEKEGFNVKLIDAVAEDLSKDEVFEIVRGENPQMVVLDSTTPSIYSDINCARKIKEMTNCLVVMVGPHASALPRETITMADGAVDAVAKGEYDYTVLDMAKVAEGSMRIEDVLGIYYFKNGIVKYTKPRPFIESLDDLPFPAWHHIDLRKYYNPGYLMPFTDIIAGRGCPFRCSFCLWPQVMHGRRYRLRSAKNVVDEMEYDVYNWPFLRELFFEDDTLTANKKRLREICEEILKRKLEVTWSCNSRCDMFDLGLLRLMKKAGCRMLLVGPESGCQQILNNVRKSITIQGIRRFVKLAKEAGLQLHACYVFGLPGETKETMEMTLQFAKELDTEQIQASAAVPFPGTELYEWALEKRYLKFERWDDYLRFGNQTSVIEYPWLSAKEIDAAVDRMFFGYFFYPKKIIQLLLGTRDIYDLDRKIKGALSLIKYYVGKQ